MNVFHDRNATSNGARRRLRCVKWFVAIAALLAGTAAHATVKCVASVDGGVDGNDDGLMASLSAANVGTEGTTWDIRLRPGTYQLTADKFWFRPEGSHDNKQFYMSGGWDATCQNQTGVAHSTIVRGKAGGTDMRFDGDNARYVIENLRFEGFSYFSVDDGYCKPLDICPDTDAIVVEKNEFSGGGSVSISSYDSKKVIFRNNLAVNLSSSVYVSIHNDEDTPQISFNTISDVTCSTEYDLGALDLFSTTSNVAIHHNVVHAPSCPADIAIDTTKHHIDFVDQFPGQSLSLYYNLFGTVTAGVSGDIFANANVVSTNPKFKDPANGNYRLQDTSPAVNSGETFIDELLTGLTAPVYDLDNKTHLIGAHYDMGAYESNVYDNAPAVITVNSANDVDDGSCDGTHCSLREAINLANTQDNIAQRIAFNISGSCPRVILLQSELPNITDSLTIDGYTQPGSNPNALDFGSDANICVAISPGATGISYALQVPTGEPDSTRLTVRGLAFGSSFFAFGSTGSAIALRAGSGHRIVGNAFGGYLPPSHNTDSLGNLPRSLLIRGTAKNVHVGSPDPADRNTIGYNNENAIVLNDATSTGHVIENNYIGLQPDGLSAQANANSGISSSGGSNVTIDDNTIVASYYGIGLLGANTTNFKVTNNRIGVNALYIANATLPNEVGIVIGIGANGNVIGSNATANLGAGTFSNYINNNQGDGIMVAADAGAANTIRGNLIRDNGRSGTGLAIDIGGTQTQLANDDVDTDTGPNALQNFPIIYGSAPTDATHRVVQAILNTAANQTLRIDFYHANSCSTTRGADANYLVGSVSASSGASGTVVVFAPLAEGGKSGYLTATATTASGKTSELAPCVPEDRIFGDGLQKAGL